MTEQEKAQFVLAILMNEQMQIAAPLAAPMAECQEWLKELSTPEAGDAAGALKGIK